MQNIFALFILTVLAASCNQQDKKQPPGIFIFIDKTKAKNDAGCNPKKATCSRYSHKCQSTKARMSIPVAR